MIDDVQRRVQRLEQIEAARAVQTRYAEIIESWSIDRLGEVFAPDALLTTPRRQFEGLPAIQEYYRSVYAGDPSARRHFITNVAVVDADAENVTLTASFIYVAGTGGESILGWGRYIDVFGRVDGDTRIVTKDIVVDYGGPVGASWGEVLSR